MVNYWNKIPDSVKSAPNVEAFKNRLQNYKNRSLSVSGNFWELSDKIFEKINDVNREQYTGFFIDNPDIAKRRHINLNV